MQGNHQPNLAVYTVIMGEGYELPAVKIYLGVDYICFTDQKLLKPNGWVIEIVEPLFPTDLARSSRLYKILPHRFLQRYQRSLYIDPSVGLLSSPLDIWVYLISSQEITAGFFNHSFRSSVDDEIKYVKKNRLDHPLLLKELRHALAHVNGSHVRNKPLWGGIIARRHNDTDTISAMEKWFSYVLRFSRRDQLTLPFCLEGMPKSKLNFVNCDIHKSDFHVWPVLGYKRPDRYYKGYDNLKFYRRSLKSILLGGLGVIINLGKGSS